MVHTLWSIVPRSVRSRVYLPLYQRISTQVHNEEKEQAQLIEAMIPAVEIEPQHIEHLQVLPNRNALLARLPKEAIAAEIGVAEGNFTSEIFQITAPRKLHLIDLWGDQRYAPGHELVHNKFAKQLAAGQAEINRGYSTAELQRFPNHYFDWVYLDTDHSYNTTSQELELLRNKVKPGGIIAGHDYITGSWLSRTRYGVVEAVHQFCNQYNWEMIYLTHEAHRHLSYAVRAVLD